MLDRRDALRALASMAAAAAVGAAGPAPLVATEASARRSSRLADGRKQVAETLIRGGRVVNADGSRVADVLIRGERVAAIGPRLEVAAGVRVIDATGKLVIPGGIDPHTHLQGGFVDDLTTGTSAAVAGGITAVGTFAYPQDESPVDAMERALGEVETAAVGDVFFHGSMWPPRPDAAEIMTALAELGQPSHKVFMVQPDFGEHRAAFIQVLEAARDAGVTTLMHCEDAAILDAAARKLTAEGRTDLRHFAASRPAIAEVAATHEAVSMCELTRAPMHLVHLSSERALAAARPSASADLPLTIETRPLYLYFDNRAFEREDGPLYVGQPPLRRPSDVQAMWRGLADGRIDMLATDHAPWTREQKMDPALDITRLRPGVSDLRFMLPVLFSEGVVKGRLSPEQFVSVTSTAAAKAFGLYPDRGVVREGSVADVVVLDPGLQRTATAADDPSRSDYTPFEGWTVTGWPVTTIRRGEVVYDGGEVIGAAGSGRPVFRTAR